MLILTTWRAFTRRSWSAISAGVGGWSRGAISLLSLWSLLSLYIPSLFTVGRLPVYLVAIGYYIPYANVCSYEKCKHTGEYIGRHKRPWRYKPLCRAFVAQTPAT